MLFYSLLRHDVFIKDEKMSKLIRQKLTATFVGNWLIVSVIYSSKNV